MISNSALHLNHFSADDEPATRAASPSRATATMHPGEPAATAVVVTYQSGTTLGATIAGLRRSKDEGVLDTIFVDNGSDDATTFLLRREATWAKAIFTGRNNGFGRACNIGLNQVKTEYTLFLNPDAVIEPDAVTAMIDFMEANPKVGIVGPATYFGASNRAPHHQATSRLPTPWSVIKGAMPILAGTNSSRPIVPGSKPFQTGWVCGAVMLVRTDMARDLGGFDPRLFLYSEETDLSKRAAAAGYETWAFGTATAKHIGGASSSGDATKKSGCIGKHFYQSRHYYMRKHYGKFAAAIAELGEFGFLCVGTLADMLRGRGTKRIQARLQAPLFSLPEK